MHILVNVFLLVAGYRIAFHLGRRDATIVGTVAGLVLAITTAVMFSGQLTVVQFAAIAATEIAVLAPSFHLCARRDGIVMAVLNVAIGSMAALFLPLVVLGWMGSI